MTTSRTCAYCDGQTSLTREHVWPGCFLERMGRKAAHFSHQAGKAHGADYVVADVCAACNNSILDELDTYFCTMYDQYFAHARDFGSTVAFQYDFHRLTRALLKIAYNSARAISSEHGYLRALRSYVLQGKPAPEQIALFAELVSPTLVADPDEPSGKRKVMPNGLYRSAVTQLTTPHGERLRTRFISVNSFYFHLALPSGPLRLDEFEEASNEIEHFVEGVVRLREQTHSVTLHTSPQDAISSFLPHIQKHRDEYESFFARPKK